MPRAYFVPEAKVVKSGKEAFDEIKLITHLGPKTVILEDNPKVVPPDFNGSLEDFKKENPVKINNLTNNKVEIETDIKVHGFLILNDIYYPGWKADIDGVKTNILRANYLIRAVELDPGKHTIRFYYDPISFKIGGGISLIGLICLICYMSYTSYKSYTSYRTKKHV